MSISSKKLIKDAGMALRVASRYMSGASQLEKGKKVEKEHTDVYKFFEKYLKDNGIEMPVSRDKFFEMIAKAHLKEISDYYTRLEKMEGEQAKEAMEFTSINPTLKTDKILDKRELARVIRLSISAEQDAVNLYENVADSTNDTKIKEVFNDIAREEKVHIGEFQKILSNIDPEETKSLEEGGEEVENSGSKEEK